MQTAANNFLKFVNATGSPHHTVKAIRSMLQLHGFQQLQEGNKWTIKKSGKYYVVRGSSTIMAFVVGEKFDPRSSGITSICAHTDSPCLKIRPNSHLEKNDIYQLGVECYGGGSWYTWFDRGLGIAGKVILSNNESGVTEKLVRINRPIAFIPNLAIHLKSADEINSFKFSKESHLIPIIATNQSFQSEDNNEKHKVSPVLLHALSKELSCKESEIVDYDLCLMDATESRLCGLFEEFIESPRLDNLVSAWAVMEALTTKQELVEGADICIAAAFDFEECGSTSFLGAHSSFVSDWFVLILDALDCGDFRSTREIFSRSILVSADMAHAVHPNYPEKYPTQHFHHLNKGVAVKTNYNQNYATDVTASAILKQIGKLHNVPLTNSVTRNDIRGGTTIGPLLASVTGIRALDIGVSQLAMHSCREIAGAKDVEYYVNFCSGIFKDFRSIDSASKYISDSSHFE